MQSGITNKPNSQQKTVQKRTQHQVGQGSRISRIRIPSYAWLLIGLIIGIAAGVQFMRFRNAAREKEAVIAVNGIPVRKSDFFYRLEQVAGSLVLRQMLGEELALQFARKSGIEPTQAMIDERVAELMKQPEFEKDLANKGLTTEDLKRGLRLSLTQAQTLSKGVTVTDKDIQEFYRINTDKRNPAARYYRPETAVIAAIVTRTRDDASKALEELNAGKNFSDVAKKHSIDESRSKGGIQPPVVRGRTGLRKIPNMEQTIFSMKIGQTSSPMKFVNYWWIIRCIDRKPETTLRYADVKADCRQGAMLMKGIPANSEKVQKAYLEFQKNAKIQAFWQRYENVVKVNTVQ